MGQFTNGHLVLGNCKFSPNDSTWIFMVKKRRKKIGNLWVHACTPVRSCFLIKLRIGTLFFCIKLLWDNVERWRFLNGSQVRLISTRSWVRGGGGLYTPPCCSQNYWSDYRKKCQGVRKRYFIDKYAILSQLKHFCGNGSKSNFHLRVLISRCPRRIWRYPNIFAKQMNEKFQTKPFCVDFFRLKCLFGKISNT